MYEQFISGYVFGAASVFILAIVALLFYSGPVKRQVKDEEKFRFRRGQFNYMDDAPHVTQYSDYMK